MSDTDAHSHTHAAMAPHAPELADAPAQQAAADHAIAAREAYLEHEAAAEDEAKAEPVPEPEAEPIQESVPEEPAASAERGIGGTGAPAEPVASEADAMAIEEAKAVYQIAVDKAVRAEAGHTAAPTGDLAAQAFGPLIDQAKFALRNQGHTMVETLLDDMFAGLQRLETKLMGG